MLTKLHSEGLPDIVTDGRVHGIASDLQCYPRIKLLPSHFKILTDPSFQRFVIKMLQSDPKDRLAWTEVRQRMEDFYHVWKSTASNLKMLQFSINQSISSTSRQNMIPLSNSVARQQQIKDLQTARTSLLVRVGLDTKSESVALPVFKLSERRKTDIHKRNAQHDVVKDLFDLRVKTLAKGQNVG